MARAGTGLPKVGTAYQHGPSILLIGCGTPENVRF